ncbi:MAG: lysostaphin resistance A-like protein [Acetobacteraceae bacterium]
MEADSDARQESPIRPLLWTAVWLVAAVLGQILAVAAVLLASPPSRHGQVSLWLSTTAGALAFQLILLTGAWRRGRAVGGGSVRAGLGWGPIASWRPLVRLTCFLVLWILVAIAVVIPTVIRIIGIDPREIARLALPAAPGARVVHVLFLVGLAPLAEELFFRGWLWTALRRHWSPRGVVWATALLWAGVHALSGVLRPFILLPTGLILGWARQRTGGTRACIGLHALNNAIAVGLQFLLT